MSNRRLQNDEIIQELHNPQAWQVSDDAILRVYELPTFRLAMAFMQAMVPKINKLRHHPEWSNVYNRVTVRLTTHDASGITSLDTALANEFDNMFVEILNE